MADNVKTEAEPEVVYLDISAIARRTSFTPPYVRSLIRRGLLPSIQRPIREGADVKKHYVKETDLLTYLESSTRKTKRLDGRNKFIFYANHAEYNLVLAALTAAGLTDIVEGIRAANHLKPPYSPGKNNPGDEAADDEV
jgi:hypothetical protein